MSLINVEKTIDLDIYDHDTTPSAIKAIQMDAGTRTVFAVVRNSGQTYDIGQNASLSLTVLRPDKTKVQITGEPYPIAETTMDGETITYYGVSAELTQLALAVKGNLKAQFKITSGEQELRTEIFTINTGEALDAYDGDWAGDLDGHNLDEMAESIETLQTDMAAVNEDVSDLKEGFNELPSIKDSSEISPDLDISDSQGNVILRLANGHIQTKYFNSDTTGNVITVAPSGADYTTIRGAVEAAASAGASETNPYTIQIASGSYDILSEFTSAEIAENDFIGLVVTNGITLKGMGITRDEVLLHADMDTSYESAKRNKVATINLHGNVGLENLTVKATHMRYAVHDDTGYGNVSTPTTRIIRNCRFIALNTTSGGYGRISYGAGTDGSKTFVFEDCDFTDLVHIHTSTHAYSNVVWMFNCRGYGFTAADYASGADNHYHIYGGDFKWINVVKGSNWTSQHLFIDGDIKDAFIGGWSGMQYELGDCSKHQPTALTSFPVGVAMAQSGNYRDKKATGADDCIGVCVYCDSTNNYALVQYRGWLCAEVLGLENATIGQYLVVGSNGALSLSDSDAESIGKVVCSNPAGQHFIKLSI